MNNIIKQAYEYSKDLTHLGEAANYIPELEKADVNDFGGLFNRVRLTGVWGRRL